MAGNQPSLYHLDRFESQQLMISFNQAVAFALAFYFAATLVSAQQAATVSDALINGHYAEILKTNDANRNGEWAWARFFLKNDAEAFKAAKAAHENDDILGTFILLKCYRNGVGIKKDNAFKDKLNLQLRSKLTDQKTHNAVEKYILAYLLPKTLNQQSTVRSHYTGRAKTTELILGKSRWQHLSESAKEGFAQALVEAGATYQPKTMAGAKTLYTKAAELGLAEGMQRLGLIHVISPEFKDLEKAKEWSKKAAAAGDVQSMINLATLTKERTWIDQAGASGHPTGLVEQAVAHYTGSFGVPIDEAKGKQLLQQAAKAGDAVTLSKLAHIFHVGIGVKYDLKQAAKFSEAAYIQGDTGAPLRLKVIYKVLHEKDANYHDQHRYWSEVARGSTPTAPHITGPLAKIDPFNLVVE